MSQGEYYDWPGRKHGLTFWNGAYEYKHYDYYAGDHVYSNNTVFRNSKYVTFDNTHVRFLNKTDIHMYDTSHIKLFDSGTITTYTSGVAVSAAGTETISTSSIAMTAVSATSQYDEFMSLHTQVTAVETDVSTETGLISSLSGVLTTYEDIYVDPQEYVRAFVVDTHGRVGIGMWHKQPHSASVEQPTYELDVKGAVGVNDYIYHNDDDDTYILFGSPASAGYVSLSGEPNVYPINDHDEINFVVGGVEMLRMNTQSSSGVMTVNPSGGDFEFVVNGSITLGDETITSEDVARWNTSDNTNTNSSNTSSSGLSTRLTASTVKYVSNGTSEDAEIAVGKSYLLQKIESSHAARITLYVDAATRTNDASRAFSTPPVDGSGVIKDFQFSGAGTKLVTPGVIGFNNDSAPNDNTYLRIENQAGTDVEIIVTLTYVQLEA